eukprot:1156896-Pelagomonas_calceolata.AAC.16
MLDALCMLMLDALCMSMLDALCMSMLDMKLTYKSGCGDFSSPGGMQAPSRHVLQLSSGYGWDVQSSSSNALAPAHVAAHSWLAGEHASSYAEKIVLLI